MPQVEGEPEHKLEPEDSAGKGRRELGVGGGREEQRRWDGRCGGGDGGVVARRWLQGRQSL